MTTTNVNSNDLIDNKPNEISKKLLNEVNQELISGTRLSSLVEVITNLSQSTLKAAASSVMLLDNKTQELYFEFVQGDAKSTVKNIRISTQSGIAGWVVTHGKPLIINDAANDKRWCSNVDNKSGFVTNSILCVPLIVSRNIVGVIEVLNKNDGSDFTEEDLEMIKPVASIAAMAIENTKLQQTITDAYKSTIKALAASIDAKDKYTSGHSERVMEYALIGARSMGLSPSELEIVEYAGILHDCGKIGIPDNILTKPEPLSPDEWTIIRQHPSIGANIIKDIPFLEKARELVLYHHERYDGKGYPAGLANDCIPLGARLIAVADTFDSMTTSRSYRAALRAEQAEKELLRCSGSQFCPVAVREFLNGMKNIPGVKSK
jgi:HD-GYP domain-containing protein (c-di-GMP phosphodiesterase class II)